MTYSIKDYCREAYETAKEKGWHDKPATFGDRIALCHSELSEALEAFREADNDAFNGMEPLYKSARSGKITRDRYSFMQVGREYIDGVEYTTFDNVLNKPEGVPAELADVCIRIFDMCGLYGIDLQKAIDEKMAYNKTRPYRHGGKRL